MASDTRSFVVLKSAYVAFQKCSAAVLRTERLANEASELRDTCGTGGSEVVEAMRSAEAACRCADSLRTTALETARKARAILENSSSANAKRSVELVSEISTVLSDSKCEV